MEADNSLNLLAQRDEHTARMSPHHQFPPVTKQASASELTGSDDRDLELRPVLGDESSEEEGGKGDPIRKKLSWGMLRNILIVCELWLVQVFVTSAYSMVGPFLPVEAAKKGSNTFTTGIFISGSAFSLVIFTPLCGYFLPKLGVKFTLVSGILLVGGAFFLMGFLVDMPSGAVFLVIGILLRMTEGVGWAMFTPTTLSLLAQLFPAQVGTLTGLIHVGTGLGYTIGPQIGSLIYTVGGFRAPFLSVGGVILLFVPLTFLLVKPTRMVIVQFRGRLVRQYRACVVDSLGLGITCCTSEVLSLVTVFKLLSHFSFSMLIIGNVVVFAALTFLDPTLAPFLINEFEFNQIHIGLVFGTLAVAYLLFALIVGRLSDKFGTRTFIIIGLFISGIGLFIVGPAPFISTPQLWMTITGLVLLGSGASPVFVPSYSDQLKQAITLYPDEDKDLLTSIVSGFSAFSLALGSFLGPIVGGLLTHLTDFPTASLLLGEAMTAHAFLVLGVTLLEYLHGHGYLTAIQSYVASLIQKKL